MIKFEIKVINTPKNEIVETKENKKSKANFDLKEKLRVFYVVAGNIKFLNIGYDLSKVAEGRLTSYIDYLNEKKIYFEQARTKINNLFDKEYDKATDDNKKAEAIKKYDPITEELNDKISAVDEKIENATSELISRKDYDEMESEEIDNEEFAPMAEIPTIENVEEKEEPVAETASEEVSIDEPIVEETSVEEPMSDIEQTISEEVLPNIDVDMPIETDFRTEDNQNEEGEIMTTEVENTVEEPVVEQTVEPIELAKLSPLEQLAKDYESKLAEIEKNYKESFARDLSELVARVKNETDKIIEMQTSEMASNAKKAIMEANQNTQNVINEKTIVEQDRDQYKSHYEQTVEIVNQKDETIKTRDDEIAALKSELANKNEELSSSNAREIALNATIDKKNKEIKGLNIKVSDLKISLATVAQQVLVEAKQENEELSQPIELGEVVESEETSKTL